MVQLYNPHPAGAAVLVRAMEFIRSVPYTVSARWLFYQLLQASVYSKKEDYRAAFLPLLSRARKGFYAGWAPNTLADDTRETVYGGFGYPGAVDWLERSVYSQGCILDKWEEQPHYVEIWFEAVAMRSQFEYYTRHVTLRPFKGDPSLDFKWAAAKHIEQVAATYPGKPLVVLYFGDLDPKGLQIPLSARDDVQSWCSAEFSFSRCGLSPGDEVRYNLPENIDKPGTYQWEALGDEDARALITGNLASYVDPGILDEIEAQEEEIAGKFQAELSEIISRWKKEVA